MKKLLSTVVFSAIACISLNADYKLVLTDVDGNQTQECIKSYSFSNNLESLAKQNGVGKDIYSEEEVMTNKVYFGKPVYRKVYLFDDFSIPYSTTITSKWTSIIDDIDSLVKLSYKGYIGNSLISESNSSYAIYDGNVNYLMRATYYKNLKQASVTLRQGIPNNDPWNISDLSIIVEYTKTTDTANTSSNTFKSYLHYVPSSSTTEELISKDMKNLGVQFLEGYSYNPNTLSCDKIQ